MKRALLSTVCLAACNLTNPSVVTLDDVSPAENSTVSDLAFGPDGKAYVGMYSGVYRYDGDGFSLVRPAPPDATLFHRMLMDTTSTIYWGPYRCATGCSSWELVPNLPAGEAWQWGQTSSGTVYVSIVLPPNGAQLYRQSGDSWEAVGGLMARPTKLFADTKDTLWFETEDQQLFAVHGSTMSYMFQSNGLFAVGDDGTQFYRIDPPAEQANAEMDLYGTIVTRTSTGSENVITRGTCKPTAAMECPITPYTPQTFRQLQRGLDGALYYLYTEDINSGETREVMRLRPGETAWQPVADPSHAWLASSALSLYISGDSTIWTTGNDQVGGIGEDGSYYNGLFGYVFKAN